MLAGGELWQRRRAHPRRSLDGAISTILGRGELDDKAGATLMLHALPGLLHAARAAGQPRQARRARQGLPRRRRRCRQAARRFGWRRRRLLPRRTRAPQARPRLALAQAAQILADSTYRCDELKSKKDESKKGRPQARLRRQNKARAINSRHAVRRGRPSPKAWPLAKTLATCPATCTPYLATTARKLAKDHKIKVEVLDRDDMESSAWAPVPSWPAALHEPPKFIILQYKGGKAKDKPVVLVGKGVTFDTGGISSNPARSMDEMKYDMWVPPACWAPSAPSPEWSCRSTWSA